MRFLHNFKRMKTLSNQKCLYFNCVKVCDGFFFLICITLSSMLLATILGTTWKVDVHKRKRVISNSEI